jgi:hypothetical protein
VLAVQAGEALAHVGEPGAGPRGQARPVRSGRAGAVVARTEDEPFAVEPGVDPDRPARCRRREAVFDRVFHQRLEEERRHQAGSRRLFDRELAAHAIAEARLLDRQIVAHHRQLLGERDLRARGGRDHLLEERAEVIEHGVGLAAAARAPELADRVQRVEEEVRADLGV